MRSARIELALQSGLLSLSPAGDILVYRATKEDDLSDLPRAQVVVLTGFRPDHDHFERLGYRVAAPDSAASAALVYLPRARDFGRALIAQAADAVALGGFVLVDGQKTDGIDSMLKELRGRVALSESISKAHGKIAGFEVSEAARAALLDWHAKSHEIEGGFVTRPGVFSADGIDPGSALLAAALPEKLGPKVADLGAGWGYLSAAILARPGVKKLDIVEAEAESLACAKAVITDDRAHFHWADATAFKPVNLVETVVMNPPFHTTRSAEPALGVAFIQAARKMMAPDGVLYLVANKHLPYDVTLAELFLQVEVIATDRAFKVLRAAKPRRNFGR